MKTPLSQSQLGVYYACETSVDEKTNYQCPAIFTLPSSVDTERLKQAVYDAISAHPYLCSRIEEDSEGVPCTVDGLPVKVDILQVSDKEWEEAQRRFARTMDIHGERLYRAEIYQTPGPSYLYLDFHHVLAAEYEKVSSSDNPAEEFTKIWTRKESYVKMLGTGIPTQMSSLVLPDNGFTTQVNREAGYVVTRFLSKSVAK